VRPRLRLTSIPDQARPRYARHVSEIPALDNLQAGSRKFESCTAYPNSLNLPEPVQPAQHTRQMSRSNIRTNAIIATIASGMTFSKRLRFSVWGALVVTRSVLSATKDLEALQIPAIPKLWPPYCFGQLRLSFR